MHEFIDVVDNPDPYDDSAVIRVQSAKENKKGRVYLHPTDVTALQRQLGEIADDADVLKNVTSDMDETVYRLRPYVPSLHGRERHCVVCGDRAKAETAGLIQQYDRHGDPPTMLSVVFDADCAEGFNEALQDVWSKADAFLGDAL